jgi:polyphosphate kinase 2 (PPK2 family)
MRQPCEQEEGLIRKLTITLTAAAVSLGTMAFQANDAAGKGGVIKRIVESLNPRGSLLQVYLPSGGGVTLGSRDGCITSGGSSVLG